MKRKLFGSKIEPKCEYCRNSTVMDNIAACSLGRAIDQEGKCRKFDYDPLLRTPNSVPPLHEHKSDEFKL